jgi:fumarate hydratase class II
VRAEAAAQVAKNPILATALMAELGHARAVEIAREAVQRGLPVLDVARERAGLADPLLHNLLDAGRLCGEFGRADGDGKSDAPST